MADFKTGQVAYFAAVALIFGHATADYQHPLSAAVITIGFVIVLTVRTRYLDDTLQLITHIPAERLPRLQCQLVTIFIKSTA